MSNFASSEPVILKGLRAAWLDIYKPGEGMNGGPPKFKFTGLMEPDSEAAKLAKTAMVSAATKLWGQANAANVIRSMAAKQSRFSFSESSRRSFLERVPSVMPSSAASCQR